MLKSGLFRAFLLCFCGVVCGMPQRFTGRQNNNKRVLFRRDLHIQILIQIWLDCLMKLLWNVQRNAFILVHALAVQVPLPRNSALNPNQLTRRIPLLASFGQYACIIAA